MNIREPLNDTQTFCVLPWVHRYTNIAGEIQVCCSSEEYDNNVRDTFGKKMSIENISSDEEVMNSKYMKKIRREMLSGKWPKICRRCKITEEAGGQSHRQGENSKYASKKRELIENTSADGTIEVKVRSVDFRLGNICNLACRMCSPRASTGWIKDWPKVDQSLFRAGKNTLKIFANNKWYRQRNVLENFKKQLPHLEYLHFAGGEPLIIAEMLDFLKVCVESGYSKNINLTYNTNLTKIPEEAKKIWPSFRSVALFVSLDGVGSVNELIRYPSKWSTLDANLRDVDKNFFKYGLTEVIILCTVQVYNIFRLHELYDYLFNNFENIQRLPHLTDLHYPRYYSTQILPPVLKAKSSEQMNAVLKKTEERVADGLLLPKEIAHIGSLKGSISFMQSKDFSRETPSFLRAAVSKDNMRNQDVFQLIPELREIDIVKPGYLRKIYRKVYERLTCYVYDKVLQVGRARK